MERVSVEAVSNKDVKTRYGMKKSYSIKAGGEWYSAGFNNPAVDKGDEIAFEYEKTRFGKEIKKGTIEIVNKVSGPVTKPNGKAAEFPIQPLARERAIVRQNALGHAVDIVSMYATNAHGENISVDEAVDEVIRVARKLEAYSAGDIEREQVEKEIK